ncbi:MAG TPA: hypothetical protein VEI95_15190 [Acidobacteriota bacterium]|nr:hypothetical protein [Acidobacteriota bacterium]
MIIGVDFDNTIAGYDNLMYLIAFEWGLVDAGIERNKKRIRDAIRIRPNGEALWQRLQVAAYGDRINEAVLIEGVIEFFLFCKEHSIPIWIISHKVNYPNQNELGVNLREAAMAWLGKHGFFAKNGIGIDRLQVYFEDTRADKIARIRKLRVTHFIDDLEETFADPTFPPEVEKILYSRHRSVDAPDIKSFTSWKEIRGYLLSKVPYPL